MAGKIFINYRRDDERSMAARIRDRLVQVFGAGNVFMDVDNLLAGQRFDLELEKALGQCDVLLVIIGRRWLDLLAERTGVNKRDYVRDEIAGALKRKIVVIPVLVDGAALPDDATLPDDLRELCLYQKQDVTHERFGRDAEDLVSAIKAIRGPGAAPSRGRPILVKTAAGLVLLSLAGGAYLAYPHLGRRIAATTPLEARKADESRRDQDDTAAFAIASAANTVGAWEAYLHVHPQGSNSAAARRRLDELNRLARQEEDERRARELEQAKRDAEEKAAYAIANSADTVEAWEAYLRDHSDGDNSTAARQRLARLKQRDQEKEAEAREIIRALEKRAKAEQHAALPPAERGQPTDESTGALHTVTIFRISPMVSQGIHNMRSGPGVGHRLIVSIPASSTGVAVNMQSCRSPDDGKSRHRWCRATWRDHSGWVSMGGLVR